ncbi:MAG: 30S ribosomal protein S17 [Patescibacteria group bacterium]|nr:30S ribosomal protein S17 [Patescibacteria group bacterium]MDE2437816.1 30S ribosomal protein S17 [Patescibacteria group bacterium]
MAHRTFEGKVMRDVMQKTRVVAVTRFKKHDQYHKLLRIVKRMKAHDEHNEFHVGDMVMIEETRPISGQKRWNIVKLISRPREAGKEEKEESDASLSEHI